MEPWTIAAGLMTLKPKREAIEGAFAKEIAGLFYAKRLGPAIAGSSPFDHVSVRCSASNRPIQFSASFPSTPLFAIFSTSDDTWFPVPAIGDRGEARNAWRGATTAAARVATSTSLPYGSCA
jgi:hypothetical protein